MEFIDLKAQYRAYRSEIDQAMRDVLTHGRFIMGPEVGELETRLSEYVGARHCITAASGTDSLEIALRALGIGPGDEVITVPFTWISTAEVVELVGATPVFVDIEAHSYNIDISKVQDAIRAQTKAIVPVSLFGQVPRLEELNALAKQHGLVVIEDAAQSFGATRHGKRSCGLSAIGSTSFFPAKPFGCYGDGGALFTSDDSLADAMRSIRSHGGVRRHHHTLVGMNGRLDTIQAAVLLAKFPHFESEIEQRRRLGRRYSEALGGICGVPRVEEGNTHVYGQYTLRVAERDAFQSRLREKGIPTAVYYPKCLHRQPVFKKLGYHPGSFPVAEKTCTEVVSIPMHPFLSDEDQDRVISAVKGALE